MAIASSAMIGAVLVVFTGPLPSRTSLERSEAECLGDEDDGDAAGGFVVDDQCLREHRSGEASRLHACELTRQAVFT
jgi:hypothetical protein